jgi:ribosomal protein S18 acetylase RimI-like enzyme
LGEERARAWVERERPAPPIDLRVSLWVGNDAAARLFTALGYRQARTFHEMRIDLADDTHPLEAPDGITIRTFDREREAVAAHDTLVEAFGDHWGTNFESFDIWVHEAIDGEGANFDPGLWFLALDGDHVVGVACAMDRTVRSPDAAHVSYLGVRRAWRGRGIGRALLLAVFAEAQRRGIRAVELGVDSESLTGRRDSTRAPGCGGSTATSIGARSCWRDAGEPTARRESALTAPLPRRPRCWIDSPHLGLGGRVT